MVIGIALFTGAVSSARYGPVTGLTLLIVGILFVIFGQQADRWFSPKPAETEGGAEGKSSAWEWTKTVIIAVLLALFIRTFIVQAFKIPSGSMLPTLQIGDHILVNKFIYGVRLPFFDLWLLGPWTPRRGDIIVFKYPYDESRDFIKRVIGLPGDVVEVQDKQVYINGQPIEEPYAIYKDPPLPSNPHSIRDFFGPITIPEGKLFVLGDNRDHSQDSRFWGFLDLHKLEGEAFVIYWSWDSEGMRPRWNRIGKLLN